LTYVIIGGGPTGVEMAGAVADVINYALEKEFRHIRAKDTTILLIEAGPRILSSMSEASSAHAQSVLEKKHVKVMCNTTVKDIRKGEIVTNVETIPSTIILWAAGVKATPLAGWLGVEANAKGSIDVNSDLSVKTLPDVFVIGDAANFIEDGKPLPAVASVAKQQGKYLAKLLKARLNDQKFNKPFKYMNLGNMATVGRNSAVAEFGYINFKGRIAWILWGMVHIYFLSGFRNRITVFLNWMWTYVTYGMSARIILRPNTDKNKD
jgi:NADH dehydrogenase